ncbi:MAG: alcohol dehydrogenase catalytic domain-containing protein [Nitrospinaceae bacterium]|nr:alcohol dehydrogenase catalytic domain-containing protein [Nitrospinaceae bacterium]NIR55740.1 alcohol dehydrogenase catalytic domain-containing protein [Nitrospinaceae bacterium]NIS86180.1 alcohol dehydrogenase catalytic domain-containing protein [Nitrospinaceae bacterium]NIT83019.1 alcohol dehydrogenase catalytic domain-containing protein [Nitrospinaceae bacterium]NIU45231.1 alcohol dehydrogenase catalytic domain-containing protein [Nitrospinaceae bacterium]
MPLAAYLTAPGTLNLKERDALKPAAHEVIIAVEHAGVCGTDLALFSGDYPVPLPLVCGHEFAGTVSSVGEGVDASWPGRRVTAEINNTCIAYGRQPVCAACARNMPHHCLERTVTGIIAHHGAFAQEVVVPAGALHAIPDSVDSLTATLTEPLAAALQTFEMTPVQGDETLVVLGPGRLGILIVFVAALKGLKVIAVSRSTAKRQRALKFGAAEAWAPEEAESKLRKMTQGLGADMVVEATGTPEGLHQGLKLVRPRGTLSLKTTCGKSGGTIDWTQLVVDEIRIQGSRCGPFEPALKILAEHQEQLRPLITNVHSLDHIQQALKNASQNDKVCLRMS